MPAWFGHITQERTYMQGLEAVQKRAARFAKNDI